SFERFGIATRFAKPVPMPVEDAQKQMGRHEHHDHGVADRTVFVVQSLLTVASNKLADLENGRSRNKTPVETNGPQRPGTNAAGDEITLDDRKISGKFNSRPGTSLRHSRRDFAEGG